MNINEQIAQALLESHPHDLIVIRQYAMWIRLRRKIQNTFYQKFHWVRPSRHRVHWIGR